MRSRGGAQQGSTEGREPDGSGAPGLEGVLQIMPGSRGAAPHLAALSATRRLPPLPTDRRRPRRLDEHTSAPRRQQRGPPSRESAAGRSLQEMVVLWPPMEGKATAQFWQLRPLRLSHLCVKLAGEVPLRPLHLRRTKTGSRVKILFHHSTNYRQRNSANPIEEGRTRWIRHYPGITMWRIGIQGYPRVVRNVVTELCGHLPRKASVAVPDEPPVPRRKVNPD